MTPSPTLDSKTKGLENLTRASGVVGPALASGVVRPALSPGINCNHIVYFTKRKKKVKVKKQIEAFIEQHGF